MRAFPIRQLFLAAALIATLANHHPLFAALQNCDAEPLTAKLRELQQREEKLNTLPPKEAAAQIAEIDARYREIVRDQPNAIVALDAYGEFLWQTQRERDAIAQWKIAERLDPQNAERAENLGASYFAVSDIVAAKKELARAVTLAPENAFYHFNLANFLLLFRHDLAPANRELAMFHQSLEQFRLAAALAPENADYQRSYAETFYIVPDADCETALAAWKKYRQVSPNKDFANLNIARVQIRLQRFSEARETLTTIRDPRFSDVKSKLWKQAQSAQSAQK